MAAFSTSNMDFEDASGAGDEWVDGDCGCGMLEGWGDTRRGMSIIQSSGLRYLPTFRS